MRYSTSLWNVAQLLPLVFLHLLFLCVTSDEIVQGKRAEQSGLFSNQVASRAIDGNNSTCCTACTTCNEYVPSNITAWVQIDLGDMYTVVNVTLVNNQNTEDTKYMQNFTVSVSPTNSSAPDASVSLCYYYNSSNVVMGSISFACQKPLVGRYVTIRRVGGYRFDALTLCEIYIYGYRGGDTFITTTKTSLVNDAYITNSVSTVNVTIAPVRPSFSTTPDISDKATVVDGLPSSAQNNSSADSGELSTAAIGAIIGVGVGVAVVVIGLFILIICIKTSHGLRRSPFLVRTQSQKPMILEDADSSSIYGASPLANDSPGRYINKSNLASYVNELKGTPNGFQKEFKKLPDETAGVAKLGKLPENRLKNRFTNVLPYDHTIVKLEAEELDDETTSYINANFITGYKKTAQMYIAAQGPRPNTIDDFWLMIWQQRVNIILMITQLIEKTKNKCEQYWPDKIDERKRYHHISVTLVSEQFYVDYVDRRFFIQNDRMEGEMQRTVRHVQYMSWLDNGRPEHCFQLLSFRRKVKALQLETTGPIVIHCSSGIGRTGSYIALDYLLDQVAAEGSISVFGCVEELRRQRMNMVQTQDQYEFVYDALIEEIEIGDTSKSCDEFVSEYGATWQSTEKQNLDRQLQQLQKLSEPKPNRKSAGLDTENLSKNRNPAMVAYDDSRTYLDVSYISRSDYINAVSVNSYQAAHAFVITQVPLRDTIVDFWRLIWDYDLKTIVLLDDLTDSSQRYWSENSGSRTYSPFLVEMISSQQQSPNTWRRQFIVSNTKDKQKESISVQQFQLKNWLKKPSFQAEDVDMILELRKQLAEHLESQPTVERIVIQCLDGSTRSGLFAAALHVIDRLISENRVDVFLSCRYIKIHRPRSIGNMEHFLFLHEIADVFSKQLNSNDEEDPGLRLKRLSLSTLYASVRSISPNMSR